MKILKLKKILRKEILIKNQFLVYPLFLLYFFNLSYAVSPKDHSQNTSQANNKKVIQTLTLDFVLTELIKSSDTFRIVTSEAFAIPKAEYLSRIPTETRLTSQVGLRSDGSSRSNRHISSFSTMRNFGDGPYYNVQADTFFQTGTKVTLGLNNTSLANAFQSDLTFSVSQSLLRDSFGYQTKKRQQAGVLSTKAAQESLALNIENWALDVIQNYYNVWKVRSEVQAAQNHLASKRRLVNITRIKRRRGTAERSDLLQVEGSLLEAQVRLRLARESLMNIWREVVLNLKLPSHWLVYDPLKINISLDSDHVIEDCDINDIPKTSTEVQYWEYLKNASLLKKNVARNAFLPDLKLVLGLSALNQENSSAFQVMKKSFLFDNTSLFAGFEVMMPLSKFQEKANMSEALAEHAKGVAMSSYMRSQLQLQWLNNCSQFKELENIVKLREENVSKQTERATLDERRYLLGRIPLLQIIQSGDEATNSHLQLSESQVELKLSAWRMTKASGQLRKSLEKLQKVISSQ